MTPARGAARPQRGWALSTCAALGLWGLVACGGSGSANPAAAGSTTSSAGASSGGVATGDDCGAAQAEVRAGVGVTGNVTSVDIVGQCTTAAVGTSLGSTADNVDAAVGICRIAASQAYSHGVGSVTVAASDGKGLAIGISGGECMAVPQG